MYREESDKSEALTTNKDLPSFPTLAPKNELPVSSRLPIMDTNIIQAPITSFTSISTSLNNKQAQQFETVQVKTTRRKLSFEEVEALIMSLESLENRTKSEKDELQKLKKTRRNMKFYQHHEKRQK